MRTWIITLFIYTLMMCFSHAQITHIPIDTSIPEHFLYQAYQDIGINIWERALYDIKIKKIYARHADIFNELRSEIKISHKNEAFLLRYYDDWYLPLRNDIDEFSAQHFTEEKYQKYLLRKYQIFEYEMNSRYQHKYYRYLEIYILLDQIFFIPKLIELTEKQQEELKIIQKELFIEYAMIDVKEWPDYQELLIKEKEQRHEYEESESETDKRAWGKQVIQTRDAITARYNVAIIEILEKAKTQFDQLLTDEQKAELKQIIEDTPDYIKKYYEDYPLSHENPNHKGIELH